MLFSVLVFGQTTKPTTRPAGTQPTKRKILKKRATTKPSTRPATSQPMKKGNRTATTSPSNMKKPMLKTFTDGSPYMDLTPYMNSISAEDMRKHLTILASDEFEGRETGTKGNKMAANYIAEQFAGMSLPRMGEGNSYFQKVNFNRQSWDELSININGQSLRNMSDFFAFPSTNSNMPSIKTSEVVFLGYGIDDAAYSDYGSNNVNGKVLLIYNGEPKNAEGKYYVSNSNETSKWSNFREKLKTGTSQRSKGSDDY